MHFTEFIKFELHIRTILKVDFSIIIHHKK